MTAMNSPTTTGISRSERALARRWPWILADGVIVSVFGIVLIANPVTTALALAWLIGIALVIAGIGEFAEAGRHDATWPSYAVGVIWILTGVVAVAWPGLTLLALVWIVGIGLLISAIAQATFTLSDFSALQHRWLALTLAVFNGLGAIVVLVWPAITVLVLAILLGVQVLLRGLLATFFAWSIRRYA